MAARLTSWLSRPALLRSLLERARLAVRLLREPAVPLAVKALTALPLLYVISPIDLLPDIIPVIGQLDDLGVVIAAIELFVGWCPPAAVDHHRRAIQAGAPYAPMRGPVDRGEVIDAEWRRGD
jgi:uncharacterized membrane protein YkvA (DUF1232 family)